MTFESDDLMRVWQEGSRGRDASGCLSIETLARAAAGEASVSEREQIADHLVQCARCSDEYRVAAALTSWADRAGADAGSGPRVERRRYSPTVTYAAAAALAAIVIGLGAWVAALRVRNASLVAALDEQSAASTAAAQGQSVETGRRADEQARQIAQLEERLSRATQPTLNIPIVDLEPDDAVRGAARPRIITVRSSAPWVTFVITARHHAPAVQYEVDVSSDDGRVVWTGSGLERSAYGTFTMIVPQKLLEGRVSHVRLFARRGNSRELLQDYAIRVETR